MRVEFLVFVTAAFAFAPSPGWADLFATEIDGVVHITSQRPKRGQLLYRISESQKKKKKKKVGRKRKRTRASGPVYRPADFASYVRAAAELYALPEALLWAVIQVESNFNPNAVSHKGAEGLMQLMPPTAEDMGVEDPFQPEQNILGGARYLRILANRFGGDLVLTLSGYHAGGGAVRSAGGIPYDRTAQYVRLVLNAYYGYQNKPPVPDGAPSGGGPNSAPVTQ